MKLTRDFLIKEAEIFCSRESIKNHPELMGINDGKSIGTYIEHEFKKYLQSKYDFNLSSTARGIDFPDAHINTDLKVTSSKKPQNSCRFENARQKIYGLGYNLLLIIYNKIEENNKCFINFESCTFIDADETGDYTITNNLIKMVENNWNKEKIRYYLSECELPCDNETLGNLTDEVIENPPKQGYLTISNAFQWRIKYNHKNKNKNIHPFTKKEFGDYQTPPFFVRKVLDLIVNNYSVNPDLIIEPTCGVGNFIKASRELMPYTPIVGIDINKEYLNSLKREVNNIRLFNENIFEYDFNEIKSENISEYLVIGNPPWITNTDLSKLESHNIPVKMNIKKFNHFESKTGMSNFDVSESIILHIIETFKNLKTTIVFLCKYHVACNIFEHLVKNSSFISIVNIIKFDAMKIFGIDVQACILIIQFNENNNKITSCKVTDMNDKKINYIIGVKNGKLYSDMDNPVDIDGECCFEWRQGIKHDCVKVMELEKEGNKYKNKKKDVISLEENLLYPLLKSSNLKQPIITDSELKILITQHKLKEDTKIIKEKYPLTWKYLVNNREYFEQRKSSIYRNAPEYSIFGIGDYTFKKYKVAISGFYKKGLFTSI